MWCFYWSIPPVWGKNQEDTRDLFHQIQYAGREFIHKAAKIHKFIQQQRIYTHLAQPTHGNGGGADQYTQAENTNSGPGQNVHFQTVASLATSALY